MIVQIQTKSRADALLKKLAGGDSVKNHGDARVKVITSAVQHDRYQLNILEIVVYNCVIAETEIKYYARPGGLLHKPSQGVTFWEQIDTNFNKVDYYVV